MMKENNGTENPKGVAYEKKPSMKRRMEGWDYSQPRIYMITLATEGRRPLLGQLTNRGEGPVVELTALGRYVNGAVEGIPGFYPQVRILGKQLMPDHVHFILHVREVLPVPLGKVINGFKVGCNREYRRLEAEGVGCSAAVLQGMATGTQAKNEHGLLWERGYHDRILSGKNQLQRMMDYIHDNPRRLYLKRLHSSYFRQTTIRLGAQTLFAYGNIQLLRSPRLIRVKCSRSLSEEAVAAYSSDCLQKARNGAVLVSPFISRGEKAVEVAALQAGCKVIKLLDNGFAPLFKPAGRLFEACLAGQLLLITPYAYESERHSITRAVCNELNELARRIAAPQSGEAPDTLTSPQSGEAPNT